MLAGKLGEFFADLSGQLTRRRQDGGRGWRGRARPTRDTRGIPKARVLPEPVGARPQRSRPARPTGMVAVWMGKGTVMPRRVSRSAMSAGTPRSVNVGDKISTPERLSATARRR